MRVVAQIDTVLNTVIHTPDFSINDIPEGYIVYEVPFIEIRTDMPWMVKDMCFKYGNLTEYQILAYTPCFQPVSKHMECDKTYLVEGTSGYSIGYVGSDGLITESEVGEYKGYVIIGDIKDESPIKSTFVEEFDAPPVPQAPVVDKVTMNMYVKEDEAPHIYDDLKRRLGNTGGGGYVRTTTLD